MDRSQELKNPSLEIQAQPTHSSSPEVIGPEGVTGKRQPGESARIAFEELAESQDTAGGSMDEIIQNLNCFSPRASGQSAVDKSAESSSSWVPTLNPQHVGSVSPGRKPKAQQPLQQGTPQAEPFREPPVSPEPPFSPDLMDAPLSSENFPARTRQDPPSTDSSGQFSAQWQPVDLNGQPPFEDTGHHPVDGQGVDDPKAEIASLRQLVQQCANTNLLILNKYTKDNQHFRSIVASLESQVLELESERDTLLDKTNTALKHVGRKIGKRMQVRSIT